MPAPAWSFRHHWMAHTATHARMRPDKPALRYRGESVTWAQLSRRSLQLAAGGPTVTQGYWNKPEETEEAFAGGWFHSGDLVRQDDEGFIWVVDRKKDM